jgi:hypothetical protein
MARMPEEISSIIATARAKLQAELDAQLGAVAEQHRQSLDTSRREAVRAAREAEERWLAKLKATEEEAAASAARVRDELEKARKSAQAAEEASRASQSRIFAVLREIDATTRVSQTLDAIAQGASLTANRSALFIAQDEHLAEWATDGTEPLIKRPVALDDPSAGVLVTAMRDRVVARGGAPGVFAAAGGPRKAIAVPLLLDGIAIAVIYGDQEESATTDDAWLERLELVGGHGATRLGYLTAMRTAQAMHWIAGSTPATPAPAVPGTSSSDPVPGTSSSDDEEQSAKRYARLLISEIKLYNEASVRAGREQRDLLKRLQPEVERARRLYEQRVPATLRARAQHFDHELVQTLAGGDALLLG